jgi:hypothetical protein
MARSHKHPTKMTTDEAITYLFHPKVVKELKRHVAEIDEKAPKVSKKRGTK